MSETIICAIISAASAIIVCVLTQRASAKKTEALIVYRLDELEKKVDKHNSLVERTYKLEERTEVQEEKIKVANHRIDDLERAKTVNQR